MVVVFLKKSGESKEAWVSWGMLVTLFLYMLALNHFMPLHRDDYEYALIWGTFDRIDSWPDVFQSLYNHYMTHGGRMVDFFVLDSFMLIGKAWFNPFNAFLYVALMVLMYWYSQQKITLAFNPYILGLIMVFSWLGLPHFALTNIWMTGACVYLMPAVLILGFLLPYFFHFIGKPIIKNTVVTALLMLVGGIISSWTIENTAAVMLFSVAVFVLYRYRQKSLEPWMLCGLLGNLIGFGLLVAAPGNYVRYASQNSKWVYHFTNQLAGGGEMLLYAFPILLFFILLYRVLIVETAKEAGQEVTSQAIVQRSVSISLMLTIGFILLLIGSYLTDGFFWRWLANGMYNWIAIPLGIATPKLKSQFFNTMSGLEEMLIYLLTIGQIYQYAFQKLGVQKKQNKGIFTQYHYRNLMKKYPACRYAALFFLLALLNNVAMIASPTFPGRATYSSVLFLIIGVMTLLTTPQLFHYFFSSSRKYGMALLVGLIFVPMATIVLWQHFLLDRENTARMAFVEDQVKRGAITLELEPLSIKSYLLRHVYYVELNNPVSKYGFCRYYGLKDVVIRE